MSHLEFPDARPSLLPILPCQFCLSGDSTDPFLLCLIHSLLYNPLMSPKLFLGGSSVDMQELTLSSPLGGHQRLQCVNGLQEPIWLPLSSSSQTIFSCLYNAPLQPSPVVLRLVVHTVWVLQEKLAQGLLELLPTILAAEGVYC